MMTTSFPSIAMILLALSLVVMPSTAVAQPVPNEGQVAAGIDVGLFLPSDDQFESSITGGGFFEFYVTPRWGVRAGVMAMRPEYTRGVDEQERQIRLGADLIHNWEFGRVHPFAGAGLGWHMLRLYERGEHLGPSHNKLGVSALAGAEAFVSRDWTVKGEARYQFVGKTPLVDPSGFALTIGIKRYF